MPKFLDVPEWYIESGELVSASPQLYKHIFSGVYSSFYKYTITFRVASSGDILNSYVRDNLNDVSFVWEIISENPTSLGTYNGIPANNVSSFGLNLAMNLKEENRDKDVFQIDIIIDDSSLTYHRARTWCNLTGISGTAGLYFQGVFWSPDTNELSFFAPYGGKMTWGSFSAIPNEEIVPIPTLNKVSQ